MTGQQIADLHHCERSQQDRNGYPAHYGYGPITRGRITWPARATVCYARWCPCGQYEHPRA